MKERLIGAAILVALVVLIVPAVLTGPSQPEPTAPGGEDIVQSHVIDLTDRARPDATTETAAETVAPASAEASPRTLPAAAPVVTTPAATPAPASDPVRVAAAAPAVAAPAPTQRPAPLPVEPPPPAAPVQKPTTQSLAVQGWVVQLGSFSTRANAEKLVAELKSKGYPAFVSQFQGASKVLHRVRVGPEQDRARADALAQRLKRDGFPGSVTPHP